MPGEEHSKARGRERSARDRRSRSRMVLGWAIVGAGLGTLWPSALAARGPEDDPVVRARRTSVTPAEASEEADEATRELVAGSAISVQTYAEYDPGVKTKKPVRSGIAGGVTHVGDEITREDRDAAAGRAVLKLRLTPVTKRVGDTFVVSVEAETLTWDVRGRLKDGSRAGVNLDRERVLRALRGVSMTLTAEQAAELREQGRLRISLRECFRGVAYLNAVAPVVEARLPDETGVERVEFLVTTKSGVKRMGRLIEGCATVAEVTFASAPEEGREVVKVRLAAGAGVLELEARRTAAGSAVYRTQVFVARADDGGLPPPASAAGAGDEVLKAP